MQLSIWLAPLIALLVGIVAALVNGMQLIVGKENKVSEFRQEWINDQRSDLAKAIAMAEAARRTTDPEKLIERLATFDEVHARIELRENPTTPEWTEARNSLDTLRKEILSAAPDETKLSECRTTILDVSRPPLKKNWTVVKDGETWFSVFKIAYATMIVIVALIAAGWMINNGLQDRQRPTGAIGKEAAPGKPDLAPPVATPILIGNASEPHGR